ncbi:hypothetical protein ACFPVY_04055 [Flavobacterium qiangtangense]|uniref:Uncharacterized protein n=1 Tax=Flavobacterium qiangtangense TaxID=1442595 RepID=A0ABW1PLD5_9FLAO
MTILDVDFGLDLTIDSTLITCDSDVITVDMTLYDNLFFLAVVPRYYASTVTAKIREMITNEVQEFELDAITQRGILHVSMGDFQPIADTRYEITLSGPGGIIWFGAGMHTTKDVQDYQLNTSTQNKVKF